MNIKHSESEVAKFLEAVYGSRTDSVSLCFIPPESGTPEHRRCSVSYVERFMRYARYRNVHQWGIYITPSVMKPTAKNRKKEAFVEQQRIVYLDADDPDSIARIEELLPEPTLRVNTSVGRAQFYYRLSTALARQEQEALMAKLAIVTGADRAATDVSRLTRLPGFVNYKPGRNSLVEISSCSLVESELAQLRAVASTAVEIEIVAAKPGSPKRRPPGKITQSERDWSEVHRRLAMGKSVGEVIAWLEARRQDKPNPNYYARRTVERAAAKRGLAVD